MIEDDFESSGNKVFHETKAPDIAETTSKPDIAETTSKVQNTASDIVFDDENSEKNDTIKEKKIEESVKARATDNEWKKLGRILKNISVENWSVFTVAVFIMICLAIIACKLTTIRRKIQNLTMNKQIGQIETRITKLELEIENKDTNEKKCDKKKETKLPASPAVKRMIANTEDQKFRRFHSLPPASRKNRFNLNPSKNQNIMFVTADMEPTAVLAPPLPPPPPPLPTPPAGPYFGYSDDYQSCGDLEKELEKLMEKF